MSKGLEALKVIRDELYDIEGYKKPIDDIEKSLKALEIIKSRCEFDFLEEKVNDMPIRYEIHIRPKNKEQLLFTCLAIYPKSQEEYDLLKEVLL